MVTTEHLTTGILGHKDVGKSIYEIWKQIFSRSKSAKTLALADAIARQRKEVSFLAGRVGNLF